MTFRSRHPRIYGTRLWFHRRVQRHSRELTRRLGGPARRRAILLLAGVLALNSADNAAIAAIAVQLEPALHIGNAKLGLLVTVSSLVGALASIPLGTPRRRAVSPPRSPCWCWFVWRWGRSQPAPDPWSPRSPAISSRPANGAASGGTSSAASSERHRFFYADGMATSCDSPMCLPWIDRATS